MRSARAPYIGCFTARADDSDRAVPNEGERVLNVEEITRRRSDRSLSPVMPRDRRIATRVPCFEKPRLFQAPSSKRGSRIGVRMQLLEDKTSCIYDLMQGYGLTL